MPARKADVNRLNLDEWIAALDDDVDPVSPLLIHRVLAQVRRNLPRLAQSGNAPLKMEPSHFATL